MKKRVTSDYLARVEGEGGLIVEIKDDGQVEVNFRIFEAPRFFEALLRGRSFADVIDFTARICGICPVAYQMTSVHAIEKIFGVDVPPVVRALRRLMYCGEWIESHALHMYLLQGPDFHGIESAWADRQYLETAKQGLRFKRLGNEILSLLGGRPVHPVSVCVGGFHRLPDHKHLSVLLPELERAWEESLRAIGIFADLQFRNHDTSAEFVALRNGAEYPMNHGRIVSDGGLDLDIETFTGVVREYQVGYSTALQASIRRDSSAKPYTVGPLARLNLNHDRLPAEIWDVLQKVGIALPLRNTSMGIIARMVELSYSFYEAGRIIREYEGTDGPAAVPYEPCAGAAEWATEAPRGVLIHRYALDDKGTVKDCTLIPPTSQNLAAIEDAVRSFVRANIEKPRDFLRREAEKIIRDYDPCISCSTHLLTIKDGG